MDLHQYWREVHEVMDTLPKADVYFLTSIPNSEKGTTAGSICDIGIKKEAARRIVEKTHRPSTPEEIEQFHANLKRQTEELAAIEIKRKQQFAMPQDLQTLVAAAAQSLMQQAERKPGARRE